MKMTSWCALAVLLISTSFAGVLKKGGKQTDSVYQPQVGDLVFQSLPHNPIIDAIEGCTASPYSHCGIVVNKDGAWMVLEAVGPVQETPIRRWIQQGRNFKFAVYRLNDKYEPKISDMISAARKFVGLPYDIQYEFDDEKIYCSELIYKGFKQATGEPLGVTKKLGELNWKPYVAVIRQITGGEVPLAREMITPRDLAAARQLSEVLPFETHQIGNR